MTELSLHVLDIAENSARAGASLISILIDTNVQTDRLTIRIEDNGHGMTKEELKRVTDPFYTSRTTRKVGLGIPLFQYAAESTGGIFSICSEKNHGTTVQAEFILSHIDRMPLGDITATMQTLILCHPEIDFYYLYRYNDKEFSLDTREMRTLLGDISFREPEISSFLREYLTENKLETDNGAIY